MATAERTLDEDSPATPVPAGPSPSAPPEGRRHEVLGLFALAATILSGIALFSYDARGVDNAIGVVGQSIAGLLATAFGMAAWFVPFELALLTGRLFTRSRSPLGLARLASTFVVVLVGCAMVHLAMPDQEVMGGHLPGGVFGEVLGEVMRSLFGLVGAFVVGLTILLVTFVLRTSFSVVGASRQVADVAVKGTFAAKEWGGQMAQALREAREQEEREREEERVRKQPRIVAPSSPGALSSPGSIAAEDEGSYAEEPPRKRRELEARREPDTRDKRTSERAPERASERATKRRPATELDDASIVDEPVKAPRIRGAERPPEKAAPEKNEKTAPEKNAPAIEKSRTRVRAVESVAELEVEPAPKAKKKASPPSIVAPSPSLASTSSAVAPSRPKSKTEKPLPPADATDPGLDASEPESAFLGDPGSLHDDDSLFAHAHDDGAFGSLDDGDDVVVPPISARTVSREPEVLAVKTPEARPAVKAPEATSASGPTIVAPKTDVPKVASRDVRPAVKDDFELPPTELLDAPRQQALQIDEKALRDNAEKLVDKLAAYGVKGRVDEIHPGPVVTMYELEPESGTKVSKIASLSDDLAMALAAQKVRIVAPIPGKARVGFELPNKHRQMVSLREILEDARWNETKAALPVAFGKDIAGQPVYGDLAKMPHLLVAGATGAGKSVGLNVMLASLLMKRTPDDVRLLMIDPKVVELAVFDGIPHMLLPVVTDMKKASLALRWAVDEMERRYQLFADAGARNITTYNERVDKVVRGELPVEKLHPRKHGKQVAHGLEGEEVLVDPVDGERPDAIPMPSRLPYIVVVVDEFADLMMVAAKDVEAAIARLAQKARAAGIHVILATQRPSVDVITGMIKANFPARIAFKVSQREDSKTILGRIGAEHLLGQGDMLMIPPGSSDLKRVHSAYISEDEVQAVCDHLREQGSPVYDERITAPREDEEGESGGDAGGEGGGSGDALYDKAVATVATAGYCSISHLQRQLGVGYNKAAKLVERMEKEGVVGPASGKAGGRREVLIRAA